MFYAQNYIITSDDDYFYILEAGITRSKVFLKRQPKEKWHNSFNPFILYILGTIKYRYAIYYRGILMCSVCC